VAADHATKIGQRHCRKSWAGDAQPGSWPQALIPCLEGMANEARTVHDVQSLGFMTRYRSGRAGMVATGFGYSSLLGDTETMSGVLNPGPCLYPDAT
jgi:hypothetical protein